MFGKNKVVFLVALAFSVTLLVYPATATTPPVASFTYTPTAPILGDVAIFNASASYDPDGGNIASYRWDFDDGTVYTIFDAITYHNYTAFGTYNVTLTVTDDEAETDTTWQLVTVREYPVASFTYTPTYPIAGETVVTFDASSSNPKGGTIDNYEWDFGDGNGVNVTTQTTTHIYTVKGNYDVTLTVTDSENLTDTTSKPITVVDYPIAAFTHSPDSPLVNEMVTFDASSSSADGRTIVSYEWDFGDGANGTGMIVTHEYTAFGNYNITLTVTDNISLTDTAWTIVQVRELPFATFTYSPAAPLVGETVTFDASASTPDGGYIVNYTWNFGDSPSNVTETDPYITHTYTTFGNYTVTLIIADSENLTDDFSDTVRILIHPVANFTYSPTTPIINEMVTFNASASYDPDRYVSNYTWNFGDGTPTVTTTNPITTHTYTAEGTYNVTLTVTDDDGLTDTVWKLITVYTFVYVHDVAITSVTISPTIVYVGQMVNITVVAKNEGTAVETFSVTVYCGPISIGTQPVTSLLPGKEKTLTFYWNTTAVGNYTVSAQASVVSGETDTADNTFIYGSVRVRMLSDVAPPFGVIDIMDILVVAVAFGSQPSDDNWDPRADLYPDGLIDIMDILVIGAVFGVTY